MYASSTTTGFGEACKTSSKNDSGRSSPVGLFGLQSTVSFGFNSRTACKKDFLSRVKPGKSGISATLAPTIWASMPYISKVGP